MNNKDYKIAYQNVMKANYLLDKEIERLNKQIEEYQKALDETTSEKIDLEDIIKEVLFDLHETRRINAKCHSLKDNKGNLFILIDIDHLDYLINILEGNNND